MKTIAILSVFLMTQLSDNYQTLAVLFKVHRTVQNGADSFEIPSSLCPHNNEYDCNAFNAEAITQSCNCSCLLKEATFKPFETQWSCYENNDVRMNLQSQQHSKPGEKGTHFFLLTSSQPSMLGRNDGETSCRPQNAFTLGTKNSRPFLSIL